MNPRHQAHLTRVSRSWADSHWYVVQQSQVWAFQSKRQQQSTKAAGGILSPQNYANARESFKGEKEEMNG